MILLSLIHGLWPNDMPLANSTQPKPSISNSSRNCYPSSLDFSEIPLRSSLDLLWPNLFDYGESTATLEFWKKQWVEHGTCSKFTKYNYFEETLALFKHLNLPSIVSASGVLAPDDQKIYNVGDIVQAFNKHPSHLVCAGKKGKVVVADLYFCLDDIAANFVSCATFFVETKNGNCNKGFKLLKS